MKFTNKKIETLLVLALGLILFSFFAPAIFTERNSYHNTGQIGDTIGGLMNPFIAIAGVIVTGLAFYMQYLANKIQVENFEKTQRDQLEQADKDLFIRLIDNLNLKVQNYSLAYVSSIPISRWGIGLNPPHFDVSTNIKGYGAIDCIHRSVLSMIESGLIKYGFHIMSKYPERITFDIYSSIVWLQDQDQITQEERALELKRRFESISSKSARYQFLYDLFPFGGSIRREYEEIISSYATLHFAEYEFTERNSFYQVISMNIMEQFGSFLNSYVQSIEYIIDYIKDKNDLFYRNYLLSNLSHYEKFILFYYSGSLKVSENFKRKLLDLKIFDESFIRSKDMLIGDEDVMKQEIVNVLTKTQSIV